MPKASPRPSKTALPVKSDAAQGSREGDLDRPPMTPAETAHYVAEFTAELAYLARRSNLDLLAYMLDMARLEALQSSERE